MSGEALAVQIVLICVRLLLPMLIPRFPLPAIVACLIVDSADQSILQALDVVVPSYQNIDKALDVYYLSIAYVATMRNWENLEALQIARALFYFRVVGVLAFELTDERILLAVFPNAFEPFFIYYEFIRMRGNPMKSRKALVLVTAIIWLVVKLPHEWWVHVAKLDATDFIKTKILGASLDTSFWLAIVKAPLVTGTLFVLFAIGILFLWRFLMRRRTEARLSDARISRIRSRALDRSIDRALDARDWVDARTAPVRPGVMIEKIALITLVSLIFQQTLPGMRVGGWQTAIFIAVTIAVVDYLLRVIARRFGAQLKPWLEVPLLAAVYFCIVIVLQLLIPFVRPTNFLLSGIVFAALITLFVALYDLYRPLYDQRVDRMTATRRRRLEGEADTITESAG